MKKVKIIVLGLLVAHLSAFAMQREEPTYVRKSISENAIVAVRSDGSIYRLQYNPETNTYTGSRYYYVERNARGFQPPPVYHSLSAEDAENLYKELSRVEKG